MNSAPSVQPSSTTFPEIIGSGDGELSILSVANALLTCHARGADGQTMLTICERLLTITENELLKRERKMMAEGDPDLATHVRRHGDVLLVLSRQVRESRKEAAPLPQTFIRFIGTMLERIGTTHSQSA
jgi:hypothetical protein